LIGATFQKNHHGPTPREFKKVVDEMKEDDLVEQVESEYFSYPQTKYLPLKQPDLEHVSGRGLQVIDHVLDQLSDMTATQISEYSHNDVPWQVTKEGENIDYEMVFYRTPDYSVRAYEGESDDELE